MTTRAHRALPLLAAAAVPWWNDYPTTVQTGDPRLAQLTHADSALCGRADDPCWGIHGARIQFDSSNSRFAALHRRGVKLLTWTETFGTCEEYIAQFQEGPDGRLVGFDRDPATPRPFLNHWCWQLWQPLPGRVTRWVGLPAYYDDEPWVRPWTRTHPRYGAPPFRYPDGRVATGCTTGPDGQPLACLYDAGCSKDLLGRPAVTHDYNEVLNALDPATGEVRGPTEGLVPHQTDAGVRWAGVVSYGKDAACPGWISYARASARQLVDLGVNGLWADNFSAWDGFGNPPLHTAFGDWSVARFREHLRRRFSAAELRALGITAVDEFDVREYLRRVMRETMGGDDANLNDWRWSDRRWLDDPVWREYAIYKVAVIQEALRQYHDAFQQAAHEAGVQDFVIQGNDVPGWSFGMPRPEWLEMVSTEYTPGWMLPAGPRGIGLPPRGRISPIIKMARVQQRGRFVHVWYYLDGPGEPYQGNADLGRVLSYELLANHATIQAYPHESRVAGTVQTHREVADFIHASKGLWGDREPLAQIGLLYSPATQLVTIAPGGIVDFDAQRHLFDLIGWGTALTECHAQYGIVPEWQLDEQALRPLRVLVVPSAEVFAPEAVGRVLEAWVRRGGTLILSGPVGGRYDATRSHERATTKAGMLPELCALAGVDPDQARPEEHARGVGRGRVLLVPAWGFEYYQTDPAQRDLAPFAQRLRADVLPAGIVESDLPRELEVTVFSSPARPLLFVDAANLDLDLAAGGPPRPHEVSLTVSPPGRARGPLQATVLQPGAPPAPVPVRCDGSRMVIGPVAVASYASVAVQGWETAGADQ